MPSLRIASSFVATFSVVIALIGIGASPAVAAVTSVTISGTVSLGTAGTHAGAGDVQVTLYTLRPNTALNGWVTDTQTALTDAAGRYTFTVPDNYGGTGISNTVFFHYQGPSVGAYGDVWYGNGSTPVGAPPSEREIIPFYDGSIYSWDPSVADMDAVLPVPVHIHGQVTAGTSPVGAGEGTIQYERVENDGSVSAPINGATTDSSGNYSMTLPIGYYRFRVAYGGATSVKPWLSWEFQFGGEKINQDLTIPFAMQLTQTASGHVTMAGVAADRLKVTVEYYPTASVFCPPSDGQWVDSGLSTTTDSLGNFSIASLTDRIFRFTFTSLDDPTVTESVIRCTYGVGPVTVDLTPTANVAGVVRSDHGYPVRDGVHVGLVDSSGAIVQQTVTDKDSGFSFADVLSGQYTLIVKYEPLTTSSVFDSSQAITVSGEDLQVEVTAPNKVFMIGSVFTHDVSGTSRGLNGIDVYALRIDPNTGDVLYSTHSVTFGGVYTFVGLTPGTYEVLAHDPTGVYASKFYTSDFLGSSPYYQPEHVSAPMPQQFYNVDIPMPVAAHISGVVGDATPGDLSAGDVTAEVQVQDYSSRDPLWFDTGDIWDVSSDGTYDVGDLPPDNYRLVFVDAASHVALTSPVLAVIAGQRVTYSPTMPGPRSSDQQYVMALYKDYLGRAPSAQDLDYWTRRLASGGARSAISQGFVTSDEYRLIRIDAAYRSILGRGADQGGRLWWLNQMRSGAISADAISLQFYASQEYVNLAQHWPADGDATAQWVHQLYADLLHRSPDPSGIAYWTQQANRLGRQSIVNTYWNVFETAAARVSIMYATYLGRTPDSSGLAYWTSVDVSSGDTPTRETITSSQEYYNRAQTRAF